MDVLTFIIILLVIFWAFGYVVFPLGSLVHVLIVVAVILLIVSIIKRL